MNSKIVVIGVLLIMFVAALSRCEEDTPVPPVVNTSTPALPTEEPTEAPPPLVTTVPFATVPPVTEELSPSLPDSGPYRVVFLLDNSLTPMTRCPESPETPENSRARRLMRESTVFLTNLLAAINGPADPDRLQIGIYTSFSPTADGDLASMAVVPLQPAVDFEGERTWADELDLRLMSKGVDEGGYATAIQRLRAAGVLDDEEKQIVVFITDGFIGDYDRKDADTRRESFKTELEILRLQKNTSFFVLRLICPGLADDQTYIKDIYETDVLHWNGLAGLDLIEQMNVPLPDPTTALYTNALLTRRPYTETIVRLLELEPFAALLPSLSGGDGAQGWGWMKEGERNGPTHTLPGDAGTLRLWVVRSSDSTDDNFDLIVKRKEDSFSVNPDNSTYPGTFNLDEHDNALGQIMTERPDECGPISWYLRGHNRLAFYWWDYAPIRFQFDPVATSVSPDVVTNNEQIDVTVEVDVDGPKGYMDCHTIVASLYSTRSGSTTLLGTDQVSMADLDDALNWTFTFADYAFNPSIDGELRVMVELVRELDRAMNENGEKVSDRPVSLDDWSSTVPTIYIPQLVEGTVNCTGDGCAISMPFRFAGLHYHDSHEPTPVVYALSTLEPDKISEKGNTCAGYTATDQKDHIYRGNEDARYKSILKFGREGYGSLEGGDPAWRSRSSSDGWRWVELRDIFPQTIIDQCGYDGILLQWPDNPEWPAVFCKFAIDELPPCDESDIRIRADQ